MKKIKLLFVLVTLCLTFSCETVKNAVNSATDRSEVKSKGKSADIPENIQHSTPDVHVADEKAIIVTLAQGTEMYVGDEPYPREELGYAIKKLLAKTPGERNLIYIKSSNNLDYGEFISALDGLRMEHVENIGLIVSPAIKTGTPFSILKVKMSPEPVDSDVPEKPYPLTLIVSVDDKGRIKLNSEEIIAEELKDKLSQVFKQRESMGVFRKGTNDIEKTVIIKGAKKNKYVAVVRLIDSVTGAGANPVVIQLDDLAL